MAKIKEIRDFVRGRIESEVVIVWSTFTNTQGNQVSLSIIIIIIFQF